MSETRERDPRDPQVLTPTTWVLSMIGLKMRSRAERTLKASGLSVAQGRTIGYIEEHQDRGVIQRELVEISGTTAASVSSLLDGLERRGYIERRPSPSDARQKLIYTLPPARGITDDFDRQMVDVEGELLSPLTPAERTTLFELLTKIDEQFEPDFMPRRGRDEF
jgi:MarR family transcriptional repressor of mepA